jgi:hypothetical protein
MLELKTNGTQKSSEMLVRENINTVELVKHIEEQSNIDTGLLCVVLQTTPELFLILEKMKTKTNSENWSELILNLLRTYLAIPGSESNYLVNIDETLRPTLNAIANYVEKSQSEILSSTIITTLNSLKEDLDRSIKTHL